MPFRIKKTNVDSKKMFGANTNECCFNQAKSIWGSSQTEEVIQPLL